MKTEDFLTVRDRILTEERERAGIGTLGEKALHRMIRTWLEPDPEKRERRIGNYVADIYTGEEIIEVQTRNFGALKEKLPGFLALAPVTVVHPIPEENYVNWVDPETGEILERRKSSRRGRIYDAPKELIFLKPLLKEPGLSFRFLLFDTEEYRLLDGYGPAGKKRATKMDRIPTRFLAEYTLREPEDYRILLPDGLPEVFTASDYREAAHVLLRTARSAVNLLCFMGILRKEGTRGREYLYRIGSELL